jgi:lysozyme
MALTGIDVSFYQGTIDWATVANNNISFAILKATEGLDIVDPNFATNWAASRAVGMTRSAYHFFRAARDAKAQAEFFLKTVGKLEDFDLPLVLDLERVDGIDRNVALDKAQIWLDIVEKATGRKPIVYTYPVFWEEQLADTNRFVNYPLWIAHYQTFKPWVPGKWKNWTFHQYSETGQVKGIAGAVDLNQFAGTLDDLQKLLKGKICLRQGCAGNVVQELQTSLKAAGFDVGTIDGSFGSKTKTAVMGFQQKNGLKPDGIVGKDTWTKIPAIVSGGTGSGTTGTGTTGTGTTGTTGTGTTGTTGTGTTGTTGTGTTGTTGTGTTGTGITGTGTTGTGTTGTALPNVALLAVCQNFKSLPHQLKAVEYLQSQVSADTMKEFSRLWRQQP